MVDVNSRQDAVLLLSSVNLPGGIQRRKSESDELQMRSFFQEGDMVFAEVQSAFSDGALSLHTRSLEYGKLKNGSLVKVRPNLIVRSRNHLLHLPCGVDVVLGVNGYIWVMKHVSKERLEETSELMYSNKNENISLSDRENISRICNSIVLLDRLFVKINDTSILYAYDCGLNYQPRELITYEVASLIAEQVKSKLQSH
ncbi:Exosome complex component rrp4 [Zancudomyces culisetae]|uniref:Exosome complex component rrp4 n=1 Tax=Zancudomyces culisetae TaxID=1213189 RepID=A0A1R1PVV4_ZANCU|nr:Exosome complex component rrp4 [Zancudomyces culisetae]|eukprot:OMH85100.1 Exosome complex component rrp4 [Zancudomyces culisetae]